MSDAAELNLKGAVRDALDGVVTQFDHGRVRTTPDGQGGAWVEIVDEPLGAPYIQPETFVIALLPFNLPNADVYPLFVRADLARLDGQGLGPCFQPSSVHISGEAAPRPAVMVSRRTRGEFQIQTAAQKIAKVIEWIRSQ